MLSRSVNSFITLLSYFTISKPCLNSFKLDSIFYRCQVCQLLEDTCINNLTVFVVELTVQCETSTLLPNINQFRLHPYIGLLCQSVSSIVYKNLIIGSIKLNITWLSFRL